MTAMNVRALTEAVAKKLEDGERRGTTTAWVTPAREVYGSLAEVVAATVEVLVTHESHLPSMPRFPEYTDPPRFPEGTPEYAAYEAELKVELARFAKGEHPYEYPDVNPR